MPIQRNAGGGGNYISDPGEYVVRIAETKTGLSKGGKPMLTVEFHTRDERQIRSYFVKELAFHMKALAELKAAAGVPATEPAEKLVGREVGVLVEPQAPDSQGRVFMQIVGYGPKADVQGASGFAPSTDEVPF
jgi:hypothetical protein